MNHVMILERARIRQQELFDQAENDRLVHDFPHARQLPRSPNLDHVLDAFQSLLVLLTP